MNSMWSRRGVVVVIVLAGAAGRLTGCATMGSGGKMLYELPYEPPFVIAGTQEDLNTLPAGSERAQGLPARA